MPPRTAVASQRIRRVPGQAPFVPQTVDVGNTVSVSGSITSSITGSITVSGITNTVSVTGTVTANPTTSASFVTAQVTVTGSATAIFAAGASVIFREVINPTASNATIFVGGSGVTVTTGHYVPGATAFDQQYNSAALYAVAATGSVTVSTIGW